jgi:hypothetical protein
MVDSSEGIGAWPKVCQARPRIRCRTGRRRGFLAGRFHTAWWGGPSLVEQAIDRNDDTSGLETGKASLCRLYCDSSRGVGGDNSRLQGSVKFKGAGYLTVFIRVNRNTSNTILVSEFGLHSSPNEVNQIARRSRRKSSDGAKVHVKAELCHNACNILLPIDAEAGYAWRRSVDTHHTESRCGGRLVGRRDCLANIPRGQTGVRQRNTGFWTAWAWVQLLPL